MLNGNGITTRDLMQALCNEMNLLMNKKITYARANASSRLAMGVIGLANVELMHHRLKPARGTSVRPVTLVGATHDAEVQALPAPKAKKRK